VRRADKLTPAGSDFLDMEALNTCNPRGVPRPVQGLLYLLPLWQTYYSKHVVAQISVSVCLLAVIQQAIVRLIKTLTFK